jgi:uncharacterized protein (TIGR03435 family)
MNPNWFRHRRVARVVATRCVSCAEVLREFLRREMRGAGWEGVQMARYGRPEDRIHRILDGTAVSRSLTRWSLAAILALGAPLAYMVAAVRATPPQQGAAAGAAQKPLAFDVESVKPATVPDGVTINGDSMMASRGVDIQRFRNTGGPGTTDPGRIHYPLISLQALLHRAYDSYFEIKAPEWLDTQVVQVDATMPPDTTKEQFREMLGNLITDRFQLKSHVEAKEIGGYSLVVAKNGPKIKESADAPASQAPNGAAPAPGPRSRARGPDGFPIPPAGPTFMFSAVENQRAKILSRQQGIDKLVDALGTLLKTRVTNETELKAKYDYTLTYAGGFGRDGPYAQLAPSADGGAVPADASAPEPLPDIFSALQSQLGLKLESKKVSVQVLVIDHMEKTPIGN